MTLEVTSIALKVDSSDAVQAKAALDAMGKAGGNAADGLAKTETAARGTAQAIASSSAAATAGAKAALQQASAAKTSAEAIRANAQSVKLTGQQSAQLSAQLQDLFVQVQAGGNPLTALIQQGSQLSAVFGGVVPALRAVGSVIFSTGGAIAALGTAAIALGAALIVGREQSVSIARAITLSGNAAGITEAQFTSMANAISDATRTTIGSTRDALLGLAGSGRISGDVLSQAATATQLLAKVTGQSTDDIVKDFAKAADAPAKFAAELNQSYNFLSASQLAYIRQLDEQGRQQEALAVTLNALIPRLQETAGQTTGLASAFGTAKREVSAFVDSLLSITRNDDASVQIDRLRAKLNELAKAGQARYVFGPTAAEIQAQLTALERTADAGRKEAAFRAEAVKQRNSEIAFSDLKDRYATKEIQKKRAIAELDSKAALAGVKGGADYKAALAEINKRFEVSSDAVAKAKLASDIADIRSAEQQRLQIYQQSESVIDALRQAGALREGEFYAAKRAFVDLDRQTQEQALNAEIQRLQQFRGTAAENIETQKQISETRAKLAEVQAAAATKSVILDLQQKSSVDALKRAFAEMEFAAVNAYEATAQRVDIKVESVGLGNLEQQRAQELFAIREQSARQLQQLDSEFRNGSLRGQEAEYQRRQKLLKDNLEFEVRKTEEGFKRMSVARASWENGATRALQDFLSTSEDTATQVEGAINRALGGMEDALVRFVTTGKLSFTDFANSIIADIARIIVKQQVIAPIAQALQGGGSAGGFLPSLFGSLFGGFRAMGGPVQAGKFYEVNESRSGPGELLNVGGRQYLMAARNGYVDPATPSRAGDTSAGAGTVIVQQTNHFAPGVSRAELAPALRESEARTIAAIVDMRRRGVMQ